TEDQREELQPAQPRNDPVYRVSKAIYGIDHVRLEEHAQCTRNSADGQEAEEHRTEEEDGREGERFDEEPRQCQRPAAGSYGRVQHLDERRHREEKQLQAPLQERDVQEEDGEQGEGGISGPTQP